MGCFVCFRTINLDNPSTSFRTTTVYRGGDVKSKFFYFARNYLGFSTSYLSDKSASELFDEYLNEERSNELVFCGECEKVVGAVCQEYRELLAVQLRLWSKLGELGKMIENADLGRLEQQPMDSCGATRVVDELRSLLKTRCKV